MYSMCMCELRLSVYIGTSINYYHPNIDTVKNRRIKCKTEMASKGLTVPCLYGDLHSKAFPLS